MRAVGVCKGEPTAVVGDTEVDHGRGHVGRPEKLKSGVDLVQVGVWLRVRSELGDGGVPRLEDVSMIPGRLGVQ